MDEDNISHALIIGVTTFISVMIISAIIIFYNSGVNIVRSVGAGNNFSTINRNDVESTLVLSGTGNYIKGSDVINLINEYQNNTNVIIVVRNIKYMSENGSVNSIEMISMDSKDINIRVSSYNRIKNYIMDNQDFTIVVSGDESSNNMIINIEGV